MLLAILLKNNGMGNRGVVLFSLQSFSQSDARKKVKYLCNKKSDLFMAILYD